MKTVNGVQLNVEMANAEQQIRQTGEIHDATFKSVMMLSQVAILEQLELLVEAAQKPGPVLTVGSPAGEAPSKPLKQAGKHAR